MKSEAQPPGDLLRRDSGLTQILLRRQVEAATLVVLSLFPISLLRVFETGIKPINLVHGLVFCAVLTLFMVRRRQPLRIVGLFLIVVLVFWIFSAVGNYGVLAPAHVITPFVAIFASVLFGRRVAVLCLVVTALGLGFIGVLYLTGVAHYQVEATKYVHAPSSWIILLVGQIAFALWYLFLVEPIHESQRKTSEQLEAVLQGLNDALLIHDKDTGAILQVNQRMCQMYGYAAEEALQLSVGELSSGLPPYTENEAQQWMRKAIHQGPQVFPWQAKHRNGQLFWVEVGIRLATLGDTERLLVVVRDIGDRMVLEEQLRQSQKLEAIGSLAGGVAHDFNNLLAVILNYTELVVGQLHENDPHRADLLEVEKAASRAAGLTRQLLAFSRKQVLRPVPLNLNAVVANVERMLRRVLGENIELNQKVAPELAVVEADQSQIEQMIMNLVINARDAMPTGGRIVIETSNTEFDEPISDAGAGLTAGRYVQLTVSDNGCGMDAGTRDRIFEPFFTTKEVGKGTGLGLSMVLGIVKQSGGGIRVYSEPGLGTTFKVFLPVIQATYPAAAAGVSMRSRLQQGETILLVEDEDALRNATRRTLERAGYTVLTAGNGLEALAVSAQHSGKIHLVLTDVVLPRMGGKELVDDLLQSRPTTRVLYMSGYATDTIGHHGVLDVDTHLLEKPFTQTQLIQKLDEILGEDRRGTTATAFAGRDRP